MGGRICCNPQRKLKNSETSDGVSYKSHGFPGLKFFK
jgi:hypothetical protein